MMAVHQKEHFLKTASIVINYVPFMLRAPMQSIKIFRLSDGYSLLGGFLFIMELFWARKRAFGLPFASSSLKAVLD